MARFTEQFGNWHTIYTRMNRWSKAGVLDRVFARLQEEQILAIHIEKTFGGQPTDSATGALKRPFAGHYFWTAPTKGMKKIGMQLIRRSFANRFRLKSFPALTSSASFSGNRRIPRAGFRRLWTGFRNEAGGKSAVRCNENLAAQRWRLPYFDQLAAN